MCSKASADRPRLILASSSPRRRTLLEEAGYEFDVVEPDPAAECGACSETGPAELVAAGARAKALDVAARISREPPRIIVACDTVAECQGQILGKPRDDDHARAMLMAMRGREHRVYSGLCVWRWPDAPPEVRVDITTLRMDPISDADLESYLDTHAWENKAGAFGYQDGLDWVHIIAGSETNVVGLPMELLGEMLREQPI